MSEKISCYELLTLIKNCTAPERVSFLNETYYLDEDEGNYCSGSPNFLLLFDIKIENKEDMRRFLFEKDITILEPVLEKNEKKYLKEVIRPFRERVSNISKMRVNDDYEYIKIKVASRGVDFNWEYIDLPMFKKGEMYKYMMCEVNYALEDLGL